MDMMRLLDSLNLTYQTEGHKHCRPGWVNMPCCHCQGNPGLHLGWNIQGEYFYCWRCGPHRTIDTLCHLSGLSPAEVRKLMRQFRGKPRMPHTHFTRSPRTKSFKFPSGTGPMQKQHKKYLLRRGFDPEYLEKEWGLLGTGPISMLDERDYKHRILIPIYWEGQVVSFQCRDITGKSPAKYKACPKDRHLINPKEILYGKQEQWEDVGICVEGPSDVWRLGPEAFAVLGISYKTEQVKEMAKRFSKVAVVFDDDPQAIKQADKLVADLKICGVKAWRVDIEGDPGAMSPEEAKYLIKSIKNNN